MGTTQLFMRQPILADLPPAPPLPEGYTLRTFEPEDVPALAALFTAADGTAWDEQRVRRDLTEAPGVERTYIVAHHGSAVATASARLLPDAYPGSGYLHWVGADPAHQGKGLGTLVTRRVLEHFHAAGLRDAVLETDDFRLPAIRSYLKLGFVPEYREAGQQARWARVLPRLVR